MSAQHTKFPQTGESRTWKLRPHDAPCVCDAEGRKFPCVCRKPGRLSLRPVSLADARRFVATHHRHNVPPPSWKFGVGVERDGELVGVAMASNPKARMLMDGYTLEVNRTCTDGTPNVNSMLYGAIARAAKALGYRKLVTYTLESEPGTSLRAVGWTREAVTPDRAGWEAERGRGTQRDIFGNERVPLGPKVRWVLPLAASGLVGKERTE